MTVGIVGMGYVGLPLAVAFAQAGHRVIAMDVDSRKVAALERGESYIEDIPSEAVHAVRDLLEPTTRVGPLGARPPRAAPARRAARARRRRAAVRADAADRQPRARPRPAAGRDA